MIEDFSKENNLDPKYVNAIVTTYFKEVKRAMTSLEYLRIKIPNLGRFLIRFYRLDYKIIETKRIMDLLPPTSFRNIERYRIVEEKLNALVKLKETHENEVQNLKDHRQKIKDEKTTL